MAESEGRPVLTGLAALVAVAAVVGLVLGGAALGATRVLGLGGGGGSSTSTATTGSSMYLPRPSDTEPATEPAITLAPGEATTSAAPSPTKSERPERAISLSSGQTQVSSMQRIDLTGVYPGGEGAILQVERFRDGAWGDFPITVSVSNGTFQTYVQTGVAGPNKFRVRDTQTGELSNPVKVTVG